MCDNITVTNKNQFKQVQADVWAQRRRDGATFGDIAADSCVSIPTVRTRLKEYGYTMKGEKEGGSGDQTTYPQSPTDMAGLLNAGKSTVSMTAHQGGA